MNEERMLRVTDMEMWAIHHARLNSKGSVLAGMETRLKRNGWFFKDLEPAPSKDWRPACFGKFPNYCSGNIPMYPPKGCDNCPHRKLEDHHD